MATDHILTCLDPYFDMGSDQLVEKINEKLMRMKGD
jgi:hypothetical protein